PFFRVRRLRFRGGLAVEERLEIGSSGTQRLRERGVIGIRRDELLEELLRALFGAGRAVGERVFVRRGAPFARAGVVHAETGRHRLVVGGRSFGWRLGGRLLLAAAGDEDEQDGDPFHLSPSLPTNSSGQSS